MRFLLIVLLFLMSCSDDELVRKPPEQELKEALELFKDEDYNDARIAFGTLSIRQSGSQTGEIALYYLGETYFKMDKYLLAADTYKSLYERYANSEYLERSYYKEALCYQMLSPVYVLDQEYTYEAINKFSEFLLEYPGTERREEVEKSIYELNEKLAKKQHHSAFIYYRMEKWRPAMNYANMVIDKHPESSVVDDAYVLKIKIHLAKEEWIMAEQMLELTLSKFPDLEKNNQEILDIKLEIEEGKKSRLNG